MRTHQQAGNGGSQDLEAEQSQSGGHDLGPMSNQRAVAVCFQGKYIIVAHLLDVSLKRLMSNSRAWSTFLSFVQKLVM